MDSGVDTGNDSNDSSITQHDNRIATTSVVPSSLIQSNVNHENDFMSAINEKSVISFTYNIVPQGPTSFESSLPSASDMSLSVPNNSLINLNTFSNGADVSIRLLSNDKSFEFQIPPMQNKSYFGKIRTTSRYERFDICNSRKRARDLDKPWAELKRLVQERNLRLAATSNNIEMAQRLLDLGVSPNNGDQQARSPLHMASCRGYTAMVRLLLAYGADPNRRDCIGNTPLHLAATRSEISVVTLLLKAGADVLSSDFLGHNPLQLAQTKLRKLQTCKGSDMNRIKSEVQNIIGMLLAYLQKEKDAQEQVEALSAFCSRLSLSSTSDQIQDDVKGLLANIDSLRLTN